MHSYQWIYSALKLSFPVLDTSESIPIHVLLFITLIDDEILHLCSK